VKPLVRSATTTSWNVERARRRSQVAWARRIALVIVAADVPLLKGCQLRIARE
jgi:hypothetical protein